MRKRFTTAIFAGTLAGFGAVALLASPAAADTPADDEGALRTAFQNPAETSIVLTADITLTCDGGGHLQRDSATPLVVDGAGHTITQSCPDHRIMTVEGGGSLTVHQLTLTGGSPGDDESGGAILSTGDVKITNSVLHHNTAGDHGGAVSAHEVTVAGSTLHHNTAGISGGAIFAPNARVVVSDSHLHDNKTLTGSGGAVFTLAFTVTDTTMAGNTSGFRAGAISAFGGLESSATGSTFVGNEAGDAGGAITASWDLTLTNTTVTGNSAPNSAGGVRLFSDVSDRSLTLRHTTIADNAAAEGANIAIFVDDGVAGVTLTSFGSAVVDPDGGANCALTEASTTSEGFNFSDDDSCGFTGGNDTENGGNPHLASLADNGGPTWTMLPGEDSPLREAIPVAECHADINHDQRGVERPQGDGCDIGAVEVVVDTTDPGSSPELPATGTWAAVAIALAVALLAAGTALFIAARRRMIRFTI
jgi:LPXTG-motif cell wall-anchored protein